MGDCYAVELRMKVKGSKANLAGIMRQWMKEMAKPSDAVGGHPLGVDWSLAAYRREGVRPRTLAGIVKILLAGWRSQPVRHVRKDGFDLYANGFNASYGWGWVMLEAFRKMRHWLEDGSYLYVDRDDGVDVLEIRNGRLWRRVKRNDEL